MAREPANGEHGCALRGGAALGVPSLGLVVAVLSFLVMSVATARESSPVPESLGSGPLPITFESALPLAFAEDDQIVIEGTVESDHPVRASLRVDDGQSFDDGSRFSETRTLPPGSFRFVVGVSGLKVKSGRTLDSSDLRRIIFNALNEASAVKVSRFVRVKARPLPVGAVGYSLGENNATLFPGFQRIAPGDPRVEGDITAIRRSAPDPLIANGFTGIERLKLAAPAGRSRVTLWLEDPGEWDYLPHANARRVRINGKDVFSEEIGYQDWLSRRYMRLAYVENSATDDAWTAYGRHRGEATSADVDIVGDGLTIEVIGVRPPMRHLAAVLIEPAGQTAAFDVVQAWRADWYRSMFPVVKAPASDDQLATPVAVEGSGARVADTVKAAVAPGTGVRVRLAVRSSKAGQPRVTLKQPEHNGVQLPARLWAGQRKLDRVTPSGNLLAVTDDRLIADAGRLPLSADEPRSYEIWVDALDAAAPGVYEGSLKIEADGAATEVPLAVEVLAVTLPKVSKPAGFYLDAAPEFNWFGALRARRDEQIACDLAFMRGFGLTNIAPPASLPWPRNFQAFVSDMRVATQSNIAPGWLIYDTVQKLVGLHGFGGAADLLANVEKAMASNKVPKAIWNVAEAPSNSPERAKELVEALRSRAPELKLAALLDSAGDEPLASLYDTVVIDPGFGIDAERIDKLAKDGREVWLRDTDRPRVAAGLWLWGTQAKRYLQWHGRHPVADPFDPLDGREADVHMIYPSATPCPAQPDINRNLLRAAEGIVDQRWLLWLDGQSSAEAKDIAGEMKARLSGWTDAAKLSGTDLDSLRARIMSLAATAK